MSGWEWRRYLVFISSTFKDMDVERDIIKFRVIPALNRHFRDCRVQIQAIDLRSGINTAGLTEEESEQKVLRVCLSCIDSARPFFIGLLGDRYGWIPPARRWRQFVEKMPLQDRVLFETTAGKSVTELEILYGAIGGDGRYLPDSFFFFRDGSSYDAMDSDCRPLYCDADNSAVDARERAERSLRQQQLKDRIRRIASDRDNCCCVDYSMSWDASLRRFSTGDETFFKKVYDTLAQAFERAVGADRVHVQSWIDVELLDQRSFVDRNCRNKLRRVRFDSLSAPDLQRAVLCGDAGCGKTVLLSQLFSEFDRRDDSIALYARVGSSVRTMTLRQITVFWIACLHGRLGKSAPDTERLLDPSQTSDAGLYEYFGRLCGEAKASGRQVGCFVDNLENLAAEAAGNLYLPWLSADVVFRGCIERKRTEWNFDGHRLSQVEIGPLDADETVRFIADYQRMFVLELPENVRARICNVTPLFLQMLFVAFGALSMQDYRQIREEDDSVERINSYLTELFDRMPRDGEAMLSFMTHYLVQRMHLSDCFEEAIAYIVASPSGLRESDLEMLFAERWSSVDFHLLADMLESFIEEDVSMHSFRIRSQKYRLALVRRECPSFWSHLASMHAALKVDDPKREQLLYFVLRAQRMDLLRPLLLGGDKSSYDSGELLQAGFRFAAVHLIADGDFEDCLQTALAAVEVEEQAAMLAMFFLFGCRDCLFSDLTVAEMLASRLLKIDIGSLCPCRMYDAAAVFKEMSLIYRHLSSDAEMLFRYTNAAAEAYQACYVKNRHYKDVKNMLVAMLSMLLPLHAERGNYEQMGSALSEIQELTGQSYS